MSAKPENEREEIARKLAFERGHKDAEALIAVDGEGTQVPLWRFYLQAADAIIAQRETGAAEPISGEPAKAIAKVERYLNARDFMGVETPFIDDQATGSSDGDPVVDLWAGDLRTIVDALKSAFAAPAEAQARVEALEVSLREMVAAFAPWAGKTVKQEDAVHKAMLALLSGSTPKPAGVEIDDAMVERAAYVIEHNAGADPKRLAAWVLEEALSPSTTKPAGFTVARAAELKEIAAYHQRKASDDEDEALRFDQEAADWSEHDDPMKRPRERNSRVCAEHCRRSAEMHRAWSAALTAALTPSPSNAGEGG